MVLFVVFIEALIKIFVPLIDKPSNREKKSPYNPQYRNPTIHHTATLNTAFEWLSAGAILIPLTIAIYANSTSTCNFFKSFVE